MSEETDFRGDDDDDLNWSDDLLKPPPLNQPTAEPIGASPSGKGTQGDMIAEIIEMKRIKLVAYASCQLRDHLVYLAEDLVHVAWGKLQEDQRLDWSHPETRVALIKKTIRQAAQNINRLAGNRPRSEKEVDSLQDDSLNPVSLLIEQEHLQIEQEWHKLVPRVLEKLPAPYGDLLALRFWHGKTDGELAKFVDIARQLRIPSGSISAEYIKAIKLFQAEWKSQGGDLEAYHK